jgi:hypothetical protein
MAAFKLCIGMGLKDGYIQVCKRQLLCRQNNRCIRVLVGGFFLWPLKVFKKHSGNGGKTRRTYQKNLESVVVHFKRIF